MSRITMKVAKLAEQIRETGCAVVIFEPKELAGARVSRVEDRLVELGWEVIADLKP